MIIIMMMVMTRMFVILIMMLVMVTIYCQRQANVEIIDFCDLDYNAGDDDDENLFSRQM